MFKTEYEWLVREMGYIAETDGFVIAVGDGESSFSVWIDGIKIAESKEFICLPIPQGKSFTVSGGVLNIWWLGKLEVENG